MNKVSDRSRLLELVGLLCDECITDQQFVELEGLLQRSPEARRLYFLAMATHQRLEHLDTDALQTMLRETEDTGECQPRLAPQPPRRIMGPFARRSVVTVLAASVAAVVLLAVGLSLFRRGEHEPQIADIPDTAEPPIVASLSRAVDARWKADGLAPEPGEQLAKGRQLTLAEGFAEIEFVAGASVVLNAPATLVVDSANSSTLHVGVLRATVPPAARGFRIRTSSADIVDLGTKFDLRVDERGTTEVVVLEGSVEVAAVASGAEPSTKQLLSSNMAVRVLAGDAGVQRLDEAKPLAREIPVYETVPLSNSSFESGESTGWKCHLASVTTLSSHEGSHAAQLGTGHSPEGSIGRVLTGLQPNTNYRLQLWFSSSNEADMWFRVDRKKAVYAYATKKWKRATMRFRTGPDSDSAAIHIYAAPYNKAYLGNSNYETSVAYVDDFTLVKIKNPGAADTPE